MPVCHSNHLILVFKWCTSIWLAHFLSHKATNTCSPVWIDSHAGLRHSQSDISAETVARALVSAWIARFRVPSTIITDRGSQFESHLWSRLIQLLEIHRQRTTAYHPATNGIVQRFHRQLKTALKCSHKPHLWTESLPLVLMGIRTAVKDDLKCSTAEMVMEPPSLPGELFAL